MQKAEMQEKMDALDKEIAELRDNLAQYKQTLKLVKTLISQVDTE